VDWCSGPPGTPWSPNTTLYLGTVAGGTGSEPCGRSFRELFEDCLREAGLNNRTLHQRYERETRWFLPENTVASWRSPHSTTGRPSLPGEETLARLTAWLCAQEGVTVTAETLLAARRSDRSAQLRRQRESSGATVPSAGAGFPALRPLDRHPDNMPVQLTRFIGREDEIEQLRRLVVQSRLCTLTGTGGSGKTRLALQVAGSLIEDFDDGVCWVDLAPTTEPEMVAQALLSALGVREGGTGTYAPKAQRTQRPVAARLADHLRSRSVLVVLDNCEHVAGSCAALVESLLKTCPLLHVLATSREPLAVDGELVHRVPPLAVPAAGARPTDEEIASCEAVRLFLDRATARRPELRMASPDLMAVLEICRRVDGLALGIELAAARVRMLSPSQILDLLGDRLDVLSTGSRSAAARHRTLRAMIDWSHDELSSGEQTLLRRLSVFIGGFELAAARRVCSGEGIEHAEILDLLGALVDKCLVETEQHAGVTRYRLLETIRAYGAEKLTGADEQVEFGARHQQWYLALAEEAEAPLKAAGQQRWLDRLELDHDNLRAALDPDGPGREAEVSLRLAAALGHFWLIRGFLAEGRDHLESTIGRAGTAPPALRAQALAVAGSLALFDGDVDTAADRAAAALELSRRLGYRPAESSALRTLGGVAVARERFADADRLTREALAVSRVMSDAWGEAFALTNSANLEALRGRFATAGDLYEEALANRRMTGDRWGLTWSLFRLGTLRTWEARYGDASALVEEGLALSQSLRYGAGTVLSLLGLADTAHLGGDQAAARDHYLDSHWQAWDLEDQAGVVLSTVGLANVAIASHELDEAGRWLASPAVARPPSTPSNSAALGRCQARFSRATGEHGAALAQHLDVLDIRRRLQDARGTIEQIEDVAVLLATSDQDLAAALLAATEAARLRVGAPVPAVDVEGLGAAKKILRERPAWTGGASQSLEAATSLALSAVPPGTGRR
jgi:predicted ATPase